ncbi:Kip1 protein [Saccharomycopsis crataegensis]|uniref:Kip1 protein n=1 Tax=Saccharomycopsis crataegensis TaxID=43959 RepID=A0AAV5QEM1_9ASCO|nr:Kip1 protein [Saccharomycopsis crataegensis]
MESDESANINVVVRCRGRNRQEIQAKSPVVVKIPTNFDEGVPTEISINTSNETGISADISSKTFTVDKVYGTETDQSSFFQGTAEPLFKEFLKGYNCTMFAYGQTGTGKTYTMHGDEKIDVRTGSFSPQAGIIPRILYTLFDTLAVLQGTDFIIKCSFLELYNEELRDLFAVDDSKKLRIFEHNGNNNNNNVINKNAIMTQNLEEVILRDAEHGMRLLQGGINKRQVAATRLNDVSSRSHTIFTINLFKQATTSGNGQREFRISKFNLVDLAGSENIGRSGAVNQRAREAGSINQSLLTLGRVINGLVDNDKHIPYRESKLTRLLQDSIGGKTKTILVANISPAKINCEETLSTLQYASKAKNIQNKPQIGTLVLKNILVKDLSVELARIKADLNASRLKNGIFVEESNYRELKSDIDNLRTENNEYMSKNEALQRQVKSLQQQLDENNERIFKKNEELAHTNSIINDLHDKINRQSANHKNLMNNSSKFKSIIEMMNENIFYLINNERQLKEKLQTLISEQMQAENKKLQNSITKLLQLDSSGLTGQFQFVKNKIHEEFEELEAHTKQFSVKVANLFISKLPDVCIEVKNKLDEIREANSDIQLTIDGNFRSIKELVNGFDIIGNEINADEISQSLTKGYETQIEEELKAQESVLLKNVISMVQEHNKKQREELVSKLINKNKETISSSIIKMNLNNDGLRKSAQSKIYGLTQSIDEAIIGTNTKIDLLSKHLSTTIDSTSNDQLEFQSELIKLNSRAIISASEESHNSGNSYENLLTNMEHKILNDYKVVSEESTKLSATSKQVDCQISDINCDIILEDQENKQSVFLPNDTNTIQKMIDDFTQEKNKISRDSLPTGKTPKLTNGTFENSGFFFDGANKSHVVYTPNRSPSKRVISDLKKHCSNFEDLMNLDSKNLTLEANENQIMKDVDDSMNDDNASLSDSRILRDITQKIGRLDKSAKSNGDNIINKTFESGPKPTLLKSARMTLHPRTDSFLGIDNDSQSKSTAKRSRSTDFITNRVVKQQPGSRKFRASLPKKRVLR